MAKNIAKSIVRRNIEPTVLAAASNFPVVTVAGPRQSGKTTLVQSVFPDLPYANLEAPDVRAFALQDPRGFLAQFPKGAVLDEVQRTPDLLSFIQEIVDSTGRPGQFVLTASQHWGLLASISQSLAGRTAVFHLLPLSTDEVQRFPAPPRDLFETLIAGGYPRIHDRGISPADWLSAYTETYLQRDVRQVTNVGDLVAFQSFLHLCAGRTAQALNLSALGSDCGISHNTARAWLSVLETGFVTFRLPPIHRNFRKRLTRSPKLHFYDSGLLCWLLGIRTSSQLRTHALRGAIFESWVVSEVLKARVNHGSPADLFYYRDQSGTEVDLVIDCGKRLLSVEIKSGQTIAPDFFSSLTKFSSCAANAISDSTIIERVLVYGGDNAQDRLGVHVLPWSGIPRFNWVSAM